MIDYTEKREYCIGASVLREVKRVSGSGPPPSSILPTSNPGCPLHSSTAKQGGGMSIAGHTGHNRYMGAQVMPSMLHHQTGQRKRVG